MAVSVEAAALQVELAGRIAVSSAPGAELRRLRERSGLTQDRAAAIVGIRRETLSRVEGGRLSPTLALVQKFSAIAALSQRTREHVAEADARGRAPDDALLNLLATSLRLPKSAAGEVVLAAMITYDRKKKGLRREIERELQEVERRSRTP